MRRKPRRSASFRARRPSNNGIDEDSRCARAMASRAGGMHWRARFVTCGQHFEWDEAKEASNLALPSPEQVRQAHALAGV